MFVFQKNSAGILGPPCADRLGVPGDDGGLYGLLAGAGVTVTELKVAKTIELFCVWPMNSAVKNEKVGSQSIVRR